MDVDKIKTIQKSILLDDLKEFKDQITTYPFPLNKLVLDTSTKTTLLHYLGTHSPPHSFPL